MSGNQIFSLQGYKTRGLYDLLKYRSGDPTRDLNSLKKEVKDYLTDYQSRECKVPAHARSDNAEARSCASRFLKEDERGERLFPPNSEGLWTWQRDKEILLEVFQRLFRLRALSSYVYEQKKAKEAETNTESGTISKTTCQQSRKRARSPKEAGDFGDDEEFREDEEQVADDFNIQQLDEQYYLKPWRDPPERFDRAAAMAIVKGLDPRNDRPLTDLTNEWLSTVNAPFPSAADPIIQRCMHERNMYSSDDLLFEVPAIVGVLVAGTELEGTREYANIEKRVKDRLRFWTSKFKAHHFLDETGPQRTLKMSTRFQHLWDNREEHWNAEKQKEVQWPTNLPRPQKKRRRTTRKRTAKSRIIFSKLPNQQATEQADNLSDTPVLSYSSIFMDQGENGQVRDKITSPKPMFTETNETTWTERPGLIAGAAPLDVVSQIERKEGASIVDEFIHVETASHVTSAVDSLRQNSPQGEEPSQSEPAVDNPSGEITTLAEIPHPTLESPVEAIQQQQTQLWSLQSPPKSVHPSPSRDASLSNRQLKEPTPLLPPDSAKFGLSPETTPSPQRQREFIPQEPREQGLNTTSRFSDHRSTITGTIDDQVPSRIEKMHSSTPVQHDGSRVTSENVNPINQVQQNGPFVPFFSDEQHIPAPSQVFSNRDSIQPSDAHCAQCTETQTYAPHESFNQEFRQLSPLSDVILEVQMRTPSQDLSYPAKRTAYLSCSMLLEERWGLPPCPTLRSYQLSWDLFCKQLGEDLNINFDPERDEMGWTHEPSELDRRNLSLIRDELTFNDAVDVMHASMSFSEKTPLKLYLWSPKRSPSESSFAETPLKILMWSPEEESFVESPSRNSRKPAFATPQTPTYGPTGRIPGLYKFSLSPNQSATSSPLLQNLSRGFTPSMDSTTPSYPPSPIHISAPKSRPYDNTPPPLPPIKQPAQHKSPELTPIDCAADNRTILSQSPVAQERSHRIKDGLQFVFQMSNGDLDYDGSVAYQDLASWTLPRFFQEYSEKSMSPLPSLTKLNVSMAFANSQNFSVERDGGEQKWEELKEMIVERYEGKRKREPNKKTFRVLVEN